MARSSSGEILAKLPGRGRVLIAFSGGPDSVCLLHRLLRVRIERPLLALHIDHGLDADSSERARQAHSIAQSMGVECRTLTIRVSAGRGPEEAARKARYAALEEQLEADETLLTGHHADDQIETVLMRLLRGAGPEGLAGIPACRRFGRGWLVRPLIDWRREQIEEWIQDHGLACIRDPANESGTFDRNHVRHQLLPAIASRWPGYAESILRSARLCAGAAETIRHHSQADLERAITAHGSLDMTTMPERSDYELGALIHVWCLQRAVPPPPGRSLEAFIDQLRHGAADRQPTLRWDSQVLRLWRRQLWLEPDLRQLQAWQRGWDGTGSLDLPEPLGQLRFSGPESPRMPDLEVRSGVPGERIRTSAGHHGKVSQLLAEAGIPPWRRHLWPRVWQQGKLVALGDRWLAPDFARQLQARGQRLRWEKARCLG